MDKAPYETRSANYPTIDPQEFLADLARLAAEYAPRKEAA
jgi:hypothetical protein